MNSYDAATGKADAFVSSMTFASSLGEFGTTSTFGGAGTGTALGCSCDECEFLPRDIRLALQAHKRRKLETVPLIRTQDRTLVMRQESIAVWKWTMPLNAEPLIEFGNNHRIVFVARLPKVRCVCLYTHKDPPDTLQHRV